MRWTGRRSGGAPGSDAPVRRVTAAGLRPHLVTGGGRGRALRVGAHCAVGPEGLRGGSAYLWTRCGRWQPNRPGYRAGVGSPDAAPQDAAPPDAVQEHVGRAAVVDVLAVLAYGELVAFERMAHDAQYAPSLADKDALAGMAVAEFGHYRRLTARLGELGADVEQAIAPFVAAVDGFHASTRPQSWLESVVKAYVGDGIASDFYRVVAGRLPEPERSLVHEVLADEGHSAFAVAKVRQAVAADPAVAGRLALWARRIVGEALAQAQRVAVDRHSLARIVAGDGIVDFARLLAGLTQAHARRMEALGLRG